MEKIRLKQKRLNQFLDLINADLEKLSDAEKYSLAAQFHSSTPMSFFGRPKSDDINYETVIKNLPIVQKRFKEKLERFRFFQTEKSKDKRDFIPVPPLKQKMKLNKDGRFYIERAISYGMTPRQDLLDYDVIELCEALDGVSQDAFKECRKCGKLFLQISKKPKLYCSLSCAFKFLSKQRRDNMKGEKFYEDHRSEESHRSYEKKVKKALGPQVRVARRKPIRQKKTGTSY